MCKKYMPKNELRIRQSAALINCGFYWPSRMPQSSALGMNGQIKRAAVAASISRKLPRSPQQSCFLNASQLCCGVVYSS